MMDGRAGLAALAPALSPHKLMFITSSFVSSLSLTSSPAVLWRLSVPGDDLAGGRSVLSGVRF